MDSKLQEVVLENILVINERVKTKKGNVEEENGSLHRFISASRFPVNHVTAPKIRVKSLHDCNSSDNQVKRGILGERMNFSCCSSCTNP